LRITNATKRHVRQTGSSTSSMDCAHAPVRDSIRLMAKPKARPVRVSVFLSESIFKKLTKVADRRHGKSKSKLVALAVETYLKQTAA
jgi:hypothetical protein